MAQPADFRSFDRLHDSAKRRSRLDLSTGMNPYSGLPIGLFSRVEVRSARTELAFESFRLTREVEGRARIQRAPVPAVGLAPTLERNLFEVSGYSVPARRPCEK